MLCVTGGVVQWAVRGCRRTGCPQLVWLCHDALSALEFRSLHAQDAPRMHQALAYRLTGNACCASFCGDSAQVTRCTLSFGPTMSDLSVPLVHGVSYMLTEVQDYQFLCDPEHIPAFIIDFNMLSLSLSMEGCSGCCVTWVWPRQLVIGVPKSPASKLFLLHAQVKGIAGAMCWRGGCYGRA